MDGRAVCIDDHGLQDLNSLPVSRTENILDTVHNMYKGSGGGCQFCQ